MRLWACPALQGADLCQLLCPVLTCRPTHLDLTGSGGGDVLVTPDPAVLLLGPASSWAGCPLSWLVSTELVSQGAWLLSCSASFLPGEAPTTSHLCDPTRRHAARSAMPPGEAGGCGQTHPAFPNEHSRPRRGTFGKALAKQPCTGPGTQGWSAAGQWASVSCRSGQRRSAGTGSPLTAGIREQGRGSGSQPGSGRKAEGSSLKLGSGRKAEGPRSQPDTGRKTEAA